MILASPAYVPIFVKAILIHFVQSDVEEQFLELLQTLLYRSLFPVHSLLIQQQFIEFSQYMFLEVMRCTAKEARNEEKATNRVGANIL